MGAYSGTHVAYLLFYGSNNKGIRSMPQAIVDGHEIWYEVSGSGEPIALIGGFALQHDQFEFCTDALTGAGYQTINWDHRGAGRSQRRLKQAAVLDDWVDDLCGVLDAAGVERTSIWATSTGSPIGIRFAARYPERTRALITYPWFQASRYWQDLFAAVEGVCRMFGPKALARIFAGSVLPPALQYTQDQIAYEKWSGVKYEQNLDLENLGGILSALSNFDLTEDVTSLQCPVFLLLGNDSALNEMESKQAASYDTLVGDFLELQPVAEVGTVVGAGSTYCMITKPAETVAILEGYLRGLKGV